MRQVDRQREMKEIIKQSSDYITMRKLANMYNVSVSTIRRDVCDLTMEMDLICTPGVGGGIKLNR